MEDQKDLKQTVSFWVGYVEEANREIDALQNKRGNFAKELLEAAKKSRDFGLKRIEELGGQADLLLGRL